MPHGPGALGAQWLTGTLRGSEARGTGPAQPDGVLTAGGEPGDRRGLHVTVQARSPPRPPAPRPRNRGPCGCPGPVTGGVKRGGAQGWRQAGHKGGVMGACPGDCPLTAGSPRASCRGPVTTWADALHPPRPSCPLVSHHRGLIQELGTWHSCGRGPSRTNTHGLSGSRKGCMGTSLTVLMLPSPDGPAADGAGLGEGALPGLASPPTGSVRWGCPGSSRKGGAMGSHACQASTRGRPFSHYPPGDRLPSTAGRVYLPSAVRRQRGPWTHK